MDTGILSGDEVTLPTEPVNDPAGWKGEELQSSTKWQYRLDAADVAELNAAIAHVRSKGLQIIEVSREDFPLNKLARVMSEIRGEVLNGRGFTLIRGVPIDDYSREDAALAYWGLGTYLGYPVSQNARGHLLGHVLDLGEASADVGADRSNINAEGVFLSPKQRGYMSKERLSYHTDWADIIGLLCLHPSMTGGESRIVSSVALHNAVMERRPDLLRTLYEPYWVDRKGEIPAGARPYFQMPVFHNYGGKLTTYYSGGHMKTIGIYPELPPHTSKQREAMELMDELANSPEFRLEMVLEKGDIQLLNNHVVLHSRTGFTDYPEPEKRRHLLRMWWVTPDGRPLTHWFYERYGAGLRGGIYVPGMSENVSLEP